MSLDLEQPTPELDSSPAHAGTTPREPTEPSGSEQESLLPTEPDDEEDELDGVKLRGKREQLERIKAERLMHADYTRKTQDVAEGRRAVEAEREQFQRAAQMHQQFLSEVGEVTAIDKRLSQFQQVNWQQLNQDDPVRAQALLIELNQLQAARGQVVNSLTQRQQQQALQQQHDHARRLHEGRAVLEREIKGWNPQLAQKLTEYGSSQGIPPHVLNNVTDPGFVKLLYRAYVGDQLEKQAKAKSTPEPPKPPTRVGGANASNTKPLSEVTDPREWAERRKAWKSKNR